MGDKIKKLSEAIRLGATFRPQCKDAWATNGASCALVAACEATGIEYRETIDSSTIYPHLVARFAVDERQLMSVVYEMDAKGKSREQIADWLESQGL